MDNAEAVGLYNKFKDFARKKGYTHPIPDSRIGFMNTKNGDVILLRGTKEAYVIKRNDVIDAEMGQIYLHQKLPERGYASQLVFGFPPCNRPMRGCPVEAPLRKQFITVQFFINIVCYRPPQLSQGDIP